MRPGEVLLMLFLPLDVLAIVSLFLHGWELPAVLALVGVAATIGVGVQRRKRGEE